MNPPAGKPDERGPALPPAVQHALLMLGKILHSASIYGIDHPRTRQATEQAYHSMTTLLTAAARMNLDLVDGALRVDGKLADTRGPFVKMLESRLAAMQVTGFALVRGMSAPEFEQLVRLIATAKAGEFSQRVRGGQVRHVETSEVTYQAVKKTEAVVDRDRLKHAGAGGGAFVLDLDGEGTESGPFESKGAGGGGRGGGDYGELPEYQVRQILAFIKGGTGEGSAAVQAGLDKIASDAEKLASLVMEAAAIRQTDPGLAMGESVSDLVLGCLRRTFEGLRNSPILASEEGRASLRKSLLLLEKTILDKVHAFMGRGDPSVDAQIGAAIREMPDQIEMDALAAHYMEHRAAVQQSEKRILHYIQTKGPQVFEGTPIETGLPPSDWRRLVVKGALAEGGGPGGLSMPEGIGTLALVLERFDALLRGGRADEGEVRKLLGEVERNVESVAADATHRMDQLGRELARDAGQETLESHGAAMPRERMLARLAEIAQELLQPLTVVNCTLTMILDGYSGEVAPGVGDLLKLASSSGERLRELMDRLISIVGYPVSLRPNGAAKRPEPR